MPVLSKESNEFGIGSTLPTHQLQNTFIGGGNNSTRQVPSLRSGLTKGYDYPNIRESSYGKLPHIDTNNFKSSQILLPQSSTTTTHQQSKYLPTHQSSAIVSNTTTSVAEQEYLNRRSKSWKRRREQDEPAASNNIASIRMPAVKRDTVAKHYGAPIQ